MPIRPSRLERMPDSELLCTRFCDLPLQLKGSVIEERAKRVFDELTARGIRFRPTIWIAEEWYNPDGVVGFAVPFYLLHPRLIRLERKMMLEAEGASLNEAMSILRHETGHAIDEAFRLSEMRAYRQVFGSPQRTYPTNYVADPDSRDFVQHLNAWYAQSHPVEDFAETFAVWLKSERSWRRIYRDWPAIEKLRTVDAWMRERRGVEPEIKPKRMANELKESTRTLGEHYDEKRKFYAIDAEDEFDGALQRIFRENGGSRRKRWNVSAARLLASHRTRLRRRTAKPLGIPAYVVDQVLRQLVHRARILKLRQARPEAETVAKVSKLVSRATVAILHNRPRMPL
ncbi:putative zinc-binding metallopeptidase [Hyphomicrobium sp.]|uniref:putative zinc-binding metallopeptidase n=1 Tax=Hyphomicrobium sp. TaxID=82 RepID=UPI002FE289F6